MAITIATYGISDMIFDLKFISAHVWDKTVYTTEILHATLDNITKGSQVIVQKYMNRPRIVNMAPSIMV